MTYRATRNNAGHLVIHAVPIFVECSRGETTFGADWIAAAVAKAKQAEVEGYMPPLHVRHHEDTPVGDPARPAGFFRITHAGPMTFKGKPRLAVFADLIVTDPFVGEEVLQMRLPYRSVEIFDVADPSIGSLALLDHEAPYLQLPMLMVGEVDGTETPVASATFRNPWLARSTGEAAPVVASFRDGRRARFFIEDDENMTKTKFEAYPKADEKKDGEDMADGPAMDVGAICAAIKSGEISVADMDALLAAIAEQKGAGEAPAEAPEVAAPVPGEAMKADTKLTEQFAALAGENKALKARLDERDAAETRRTDVAAALKRLEGRPLGADLEGDLVAFHKEHGPKAFAAYVGKIATTFGTLEGTPAEGGRGANFAAHPTNSSEAVLAFVEKGAEATEKAAKFSAEWRQLHDAGHTRMSEQRYVEIGMARAGITLTKK